MREIIAKWISDAKTEVSSHKNIYLVLSVILIFAFLVRLWRVDQILGFYFDQGRDAKVIWDFWHNGRFFLIGPTTGIEGIFRGPWYYWLIAPWYLLGNGDPVWPSVFLAFTTIIAILLTYVTGVMVGTRITGLVAVIIASLSFYLVYASRWLSNPTLMLLISMIVVLSMFLVVEGKRWAWVLVSFALGMAMQFGSAAEIFYFPVLVIFAVWQHKNLPDRKTFLIAFCLFLISLLPQIIFDIRHEGILRAGIARFLFGEESFKLSFWEVVKIRLPFYFDVFSSKLFVGGQLYKIFFASAALAIFLLHLKELLSNKKFVTLLILFVAPMAGMLFFQGNYGNVYDYYFTGYYLVFVLIFATLVGGASRYIWGQFLLGAFLLIFIANNGSVLAGYLPSGVDGPSTIALGNQKQVIDWVYQDAGDRPFNVDVYVPPVIPHAYDYLFLWWGTTRYERTPTQVQLPLLYTLYEQDPPHPERLEAWYRRQAGIGAVEKTVKFGGITVERRERIK